LLIHYNQTLVMMQHFICDQLRSTRFCVKPKASDPIHLQGQTNYLQNISRLLRSSSLVH
jgi:hypothetical protein